MLNDRGQVLLSRRTERQTFAGMWEFPGGKVFLSEGCSAGLFSTAADLKIEHASSDPCIVSRFRWRKMRGPKQHW